MKCWIKYWVLLGYILSIPLFMLIGAVSFAVFRLDEWSEKYGQ